MANPLYINFSCPTKLYLRKFLEFDLPASNVADQRTLLGQTLVTQIERSKTSYYQFFADDDYDTDFNSHISCKLPYWYMERMGLKLDEHHIIFLNNLWTHQFFQQAHCAFDVAYNLSHGRFTYRQMIDEFLDRYNIVEEELSYSTVRKRYQRYKEWLEKNEKR